MPLVKRLQFLDVKALPIALEHLAEIAPRLSAPRRLTDGSVIAGEQYEIELDLDRSTVALFVLSFEERAARASAPRVPR